MSQHDRETGSSGPVGLQVSVRTMIILLLALAAGVVTTVLLWSTAVPLAHALLGGTVSSVGALRFFDKIIKPI